MAALRSRDLPLPVMRQRAHLDGEADMTASLHSRVRRKMLAIPAPCYACAHRSLRHTGTDERCIIMCPVDERARKRQRVRERDECDDGSCSWLCQCLYEVLRTPLANPAGSGDYAPFAETGGSRGAPPGPSELGPTQGASQKSHGVSYVKDEPHAKAYLGVGRRTGYRGSALSTNLTTYTQYWRRRLSLTAKLMFLTCKHACVCMPSIQVLVFVYHRTPYYCLVRYWLPNCRSGKLCSVLPGLFAYQAMDDPCW
jgi:hypothetical protein